jgi:hypothetical protein
MSFSSRPAKSAKTLGLLTLLSVLVTLVVAWAASAAPAPSAPTLTSKPDAATPNTSATFVFASSGTGITYQCSLDTAAFAACSSPKTYAGLAQGNHTFRVKAIAGGKESSITSYTWLVDSVAPPVPTIVGKPAALSNTASPSFVFTDTESGVGFLCRLDGGLSAPCTSPKGYFSLAQGSHTFEVQARDAAGNTSTAATYSWTIDSIAPAAPTITSRPDNPAPSAVSTFTWTAAESGLSFQCMIDQPGVWEPCDSPFTKTVDVSSNEMHQFSVRAIDAASNVSALASYQWKVQQSIAFTITGNADGPLYPGLWRSLNLEIDNPNNSTIYVTEVIAEAANSPVGCAPSTNLEFQQSDASSSQPIAVPAKSKVNVSAARRPRVRLRNLPVNQDACKNQTFQFTYRGSATK